MVSVRVSCDESGRSPTKRRSLKRTFDMFLGNHELKRAEDLPCRSVLGRPARHLRCHLLAGQDAGATEMLLRIKMHDE